MRKLFVFIIAVMFTALTSMAQTDDAKRISISAVQPEYDNISEAETTQSSRTTIMEKNRYSQVSDKKLDINNNDTPLQQSLSKKTLKVPLYYKNPFNLLICSSQSSIGKTKYFSLQHEDNLLVNSN